MQFEVPEEILDSLTGLTGGITYEKHTFFWDSWRSYSIFYGI